MALVEAPDGQRQERKDEDRAQQVHDPAGQLFAGVSLADDLVLRVGPIWHDHTLDHRTASVDILTEEGWRRMQPKRGIAAPTWARPQGVGLQSRPVPAAHPAPNLGRNATPEGSGGRGTEAEIT